MPLVECISLELLLKPALPSMKQCGLGCQQAIEHCKSEEHPGFASLACSIAFSLDVHKRFHSFIKGFPFTSSPQECLEDHMDESGFSAECKEELGGMIAKVGVLFFFCALLLSQ